MPRPNLSKLIFDWEGKLSYGQSSENKRLRPETPQPPQWFRPDFHSVKTILAGKSPVHMLTFMTTQSKYQPVIYNPLEDHLTQFTWTDDQGQNWKWNAAAFAVTRVRFRPLLPGAQERQPPPVVFDQCWLSAVSHALRGEQPPLRLSAGPGSGTAVTIAAGQLVTADFTFRGKLGARRTQQPYDLTRSTP